MKQILKAALCTGVISTLSACGSTSYYNSLNPSAGQAELNRDSYECEQENRYKKEGKNSTFLDKRRYRKCLHARGWNER